MTMKDDDYLWDPKAAPDHDVERLEQMLGRLRSTATTPPRITVRLKPDITDTRGADHRDVVGADPRVRPSTYVGIRFFVPALAAAAAIVLMVGLTWRNAAPDATSADPTAGK